MKSIDKIMDTVAKVQSEPKQMGYPTVMYVPECKTYIRVKRGTHMDPRYVRELVRGYCESHLGCRAKEVSRDLGISVDQALRAMLFLRREWRKY